MLNSIIKELNDLDDVGGKQDLTKEIVDTLVLNKIIAPGMKAQYEYALSLWFERTLTLSSLFFLAVYLGKIIPAVFFLASFLLLRRHTGGFHSGSFFGCYIESGIIFLLIMSYGEFIASSPVLMYGLLAISFVFIFLTGTVNHPNLRFNKYELQESKRVARYILLLETFVVLALDTLTAAENYTCYMYLGIIMCALSLMFAKMTKQEVTEE